MNKIVVNYLQRTFFAVFFVSVILTIFFAVKPEDAYNSDFKSFIIGALIVRNGEAKNLYSIQTQTRYQDKILVSVGLDKNKDATLNIFPYFPLVALFFVPFTFPPYLLAFKLHILILFLVLTLNYYFAIKIFDKVKFRPIIFLFFFLFYPSLGSVVAGQLSVWLLLIFLSIYKNIRSKNYFKVGLIASLLILKIQYIIFIPFLPLIHKSKTKTLFKGLAIGSGVIIAVNYLLAGPFWRAYLTMLPLVQRSEYHTLNSKMFTFFAFLRDTPVFSNYNFYQLLLVNFILYTFFYLAFFVVKNKFSTDRGFVLALLLTFVFSVHGVDYDLALLPLVLLILIGDIGIKPKLLSANNIVILTLTTAPLLVLFGKGVYLSLVLLVCSIILGLPNKKPSSF